MTDNLTTNNLSPFVSEETLNKDFKFKDFISNETNPLPLIPGIYFNNDDNSIKRDNIGSKIINNYYNIKICMKKLLIIKTFILSILKVSGGNDLDKINISKEKYKLLKTNLIIPFNDNLSNTFKDQDYFKKFIKLYKEQKYGIFKNFNLEIPYFFQIFQVEYNNAPKTFFISLFNKYITLRRKILTYITENFSLLAFTSFFDLSDNIDFGMLKNYIRNKNGNNDNEYNEKYNNYVLYGNNINILSNESKVNKKKITEKIHTFDYLYVSKFDNAYYKRKHQEQIHKNYFNLKESINNFIGPNASFDLLSVIKNNLEVDYNTINFIFNYVDPLIYGKAVDSNILVKQFISKKINNFELYYDQYMYWIKTLCNNIEGKKSNIDNDYNFRKFYDNILNNIDKEYKSPCGDSDGTNGGLRSESSSGNTRKPPGEPPGETNNGSNKNKGKPPGGTNDGLDPSNIDPDNNDPEYIRLKLDIINFFMLNIGENLNNVIKGREEIYKSFKKNTNNIKIKNEYTIKLEKLKKIKKDLENNFLKLNDEEKNLYIKKLEKLQEKNNKYNNNANNANNPNNENNNKDLLKKIDILSKKLLKVHFKLTTIDNIDKNYTENKLNEETKKLKGQFGKQIENYDEIINELKKYLVMNDKEKNNYRENLLKEFNNLNKERESLIDKGIQKGIINPN